MAVTASMVKELREMTGAGMMDCKKALSATDGDFDKAIEFLREKGLATAEKKAGRIAAEGLVATTIKDGDKVAAIVEVNAETDFVAKNEVFQTFVQEIADQALVSSLNGGDNGEDVAALLEEGGLKDALVEKTATIGEKLSFRRFEKVTGDCVVSYLHGGGRIGVLVAGAGAADDSVKEALGNVSMQIAAMNPQYICRADISVDEMAKLKEITIDSALNDPFSLPKPILQGLLDKAVNDKKWSDEDIAIYEEKKSNMNYLPNFLSTEAKNTLAELAMADKDAIVGNKIFNGLVEGRISKHVKAISLMDQTYVKAEDGKQSVAKYLESVSKDLKVAKFVRFEVGEGMEKKNEDFAAEVAAQMGN